MIGSERFMYLLTAFFGAVGFVSLWPTQGFRFAFAFALGSGASAGNLFLFAYLARAISPNGSPAGGGKKPWRAALLLSRYILMFGFGYVIVKGLDVNPLAVLLGLLASTAAVVASILIELFERLIHGT